MNEWVLIGGAVLLLIGLTWAFSKVNASRREADKS